MVIVVALGVVQEVGVQFIKPAQNTQKVEPNAASQSNDEAINDEFANTQQFQDFQQPPPPPPPSASKNPEE